MIRRRTLLLGAGVAAVAAACSGAKNRLAPVAAPAPTPPSTSTPPPTTTPPATTPPATTPRTVAPAGPAVYIAHGATTSTGVALTFHTAGDPAITQSLLQQAAGLGAKLTFFVVGTWATANPGVVAQILDGGHELGNHTWSHIDLPALPPDAMYAEIERCAAVLQRETGSISKWFRPSQTDVPTAAILQQAGRAGYATSVGYDIDPLDYTDPGATAVTSRVAAKLHGGAIVSLHTLYEGTAVAFPNLVTSIRAAGLQPVTTSSVLSG